MLLVYCLHGDEVVTEQIAKKMSKELGIETYLGNPAARRKQARFIESDLNRSFGRTGTPEAERAGEIMEDLLPRSEDLIIDLHTTTAKMPPMGIITSVAQLKSASRLGLKNLILMNERFSTGGSLIENIPNSISLEIYPDEESIEQVEKFILNGLNSGQKTKCFNIYEVTDIIKKEDVREPVVNLQKMQDGAYPVFYGEQAYKDVAYLKTRKRIINI